MAKSPSEISTRQTSLLFAVIGLIVLAILSLVAVQSGAIEALNHSELLRR